MTPPDVSSVVRWMWFGLRASVGIELSAGRAFGNPAPGWGVQLL